MKKLLLFILCITGAWNMLQAQYIRCGADEYQAALEASDPHLKMLRQAALEQANQLSENNQASRGSFVVTIPVVFHVIYNGSAQNIPDARIYEQLDVLNADFSRTNADAINTRSMFLQVAANTQIQFCLAQRTPAGAATTGIVRVSTSSSFPNNPHTLSPEWDHTKYLNVYIGNLGGGLLGYANLPPGSTGNDHVVILYSAVGGPNVPGTATPYHLGRTATHEIGHWLNLQHTFQGGCSGLTNNTCTSSGDYVCDTPPVNSPHFGCPTNNPNTCTETSPFPAPYTSNMVDMYENYLDYTDDGCMNIFSIGQANRMNNAITQLRSALLSSQGCVPVGISEVMDETYVMTGPNPSTDYFGVQFNFPVATKILLTVTDITGKTIIAKQFNTAEINYTTLDFTQNAQGVYLMKVESDKGSLVKRLVKN